MNLICCSSKKMGRPYSSSSTGSPLELAAAAWPLPKPLVYHDASIQLQIIATKIYDDDGQSNNVRQFQPLDYHMEIGEGVCDVPEEAMTTPDEKAAMHSVLNEVESLHVHDTSSVATVLAADYIFMAEAKARPLDMMNSLRRCRVERCSKLDTVFGIIVVPDQSQYHRAKPRCFSSLETFWAAHLLTARSIWRRPSTWLPWSTVDSQSFGQLKSIHIYFCPRLRYVLPLSTLSGFPHNLETLHVVHCSDLEQVFPVEQDLHLHIARLGEKRRDSLEFPMLKELRLQELPSLKQICDAEMFTPNLQTVYVRGCRNLRRLTAMDYELRQYALVDCEKDWWEELEWDGMESGHHPSLFRPRRHSKYYRKRHLRGTVLR